MEKIIRCRDVDFGVDCGQEIRAQSKEEVVNQFVKHATEAHYGVTGPPPAVIQKAYAAIRVKSGVPILGLWIFVVWTGCILLFRMIIWPVQTILHRPISMTNLEWWYIYCILFILAVWILFLFSRVRILILDKEWKIPSLVSFLDENSEFRSRTATSEKLTSLYFDKARTVALPLSITGVALTFLLIVILEDYVVEEKPIKITAQSLESLEGQVPGYVIQKLDDSIKNQEFTKEESLDVLSIAIGDEEAIVYRKSILKHAERPLLTYKEILSYFGVLFSFISLALIFFALEFLDTVANPFKDEWHQRGIKRTQRFFFRDVDSFGGIGFTYCAYAALSVAAASIASLLFYPHFAFYACLGFIFFGLPYMFGYYEFNKDDKVVLNRKKQKQKKKQASTMKNNDVGRETLRLGFKRLMLIYFIIFGAFQYIHYNFPDTILPWIDFSWIKNFF